MTHTSGNTQMFALRSGPPKRIELDGAGYELRRVFKHDFWAATCLYGFDDDSPGPTPEILQIVVKFGRQQPFCGLPIGFYGRWLANHEHAIYKKLEGIEGIPRCLGLTAKDGLAIEYIDALPLDHHRDVPSVLFDDLRRLLNEVHDRGVAYCDANKRSNILVAPNGRAFLIDYQIALATRDKLPWPLRAILRHAVRYMAERDLYHLYKHKRRLLPDELKPEEEALSRKLGGLHLLHRKLTKFYRHLRRRFLHSQYSKGALRSPTAELEDHPQPEKASWRDNTTPPLADQ